MRTIDEWSQQLLDLYGLRNECYLQGLQERIIFLINGIRILRRQIRRRESHETLQTAVARVFARTLAAGQHFTRLPVALAMEQKYGHGCSYCNHQPCQCRQESRAEPRLFVNVTVKGTQPLSALCVRLRETYAIKNERLGTYWLLDRLSDEVSELIAIAECMRQGTIDPQDARKKMAYELADVLAWTIAIANLYRIDLPQALEDRYGAVCWSCHEKPCNCPPYVFTPERHQ